MWPEAPVRVAIFGCGQIGARWDAPGAAGTAAGQPSLTHAAAFTRHAGAQVVAFCDADLSRAREAASRWGVDGAFDDAAQALSNTRPQVAVIASASAVRSSLVDAALDAGVRTLVIEKPLATTLGECQSLVRRIETEGAVALVNYLRHWDRGMLDLRDRASRGDFGDWQRLVGSYGKGLSNNGSHLIDLAGLLADARPVRARSLGSPLRASEAGWSGGTDTALDAQVRLRTAAGDELQLDMIATDASAFSCFELRLIGTRAVAEMGLGGRRIDWTAMADDPNFTGYRVPGERQALASGLLQAMDGMADEAVRLARGQSTAPSCGARDALRTATTVEAIRQSARDGGAWIDIE